MMSQVGLATRRRKSLPERGDALCEVFVVEKKIHGGFKVMK